MRQVEITLTFTDEDGTSRPYTLRLQTPRNGTPEGEARVAHHLFSELRVAMRDQPAPKHNAAAGQWLQFPKTKIDFSQFFDVRNSQSLWLELSNLVRGIEHDLEMARAFKELEPAEEPPFEDDEAINNLYFLHDRKMSALDRAVYELIKVQDLVSRLLHESLGGDLVDTSKPNWERTKLTRDDVERGLQAKLASGTLSQSDFDAISAALDIPKNTPHGDTALAYRRRLMHHIKPSVDYSMFFSGLESREGEVMTDSTGKITGTGHVIRTRPPVQYLFQDLHVSLTDYLEAVVSMLQKLSEVEILRRVGHINAESIMPCCPSNVDTKQLGVRHFSRFSRSGLPPRLLGPLLPILSSRFLFLPASPAGCPRFASVLWTLTWGMVPLTHSPSFT